MGLNFRTGIRMGLNFTPGTKVYKIEWSLLKINFKHCSSKFKLYKFFMFFTSDILIINYKFICTHLFLDLKMGYKTIYNLYFTLKFQ